MQNDENDQTNDIVIHHLPPVDADEMQRIVRAASEALARRRLRRRDDEQQT